MIIICQTFLKNTKITGISFFPFIFLKDKKDKSNKILLNHEKIHLRQQLEMLIVFFYIWYVIEYFYRLLKIKNKYEAYKNISFEREAYKMENHLDYLKKRKFWSFYKYLYTKP